MIWLRKGSEGDHYRPAKRYTTPASQMDVKYTPVMEDINDSIRQKKVSQLSGERYLRVADVINRT